jgi:hypothetical protein
MAAERQGVLLRELEPDLALLQEVNPGSTEALRRAARADWIVRAVDLRAAMPDDRPVRSRAVGIAGRGSPPTDAWLLMDASLPERTLSCSKIGFGS